MKVVIVGGYGVFGSRLAELLMRDGTWRTEYGFAQSCPDAPGLAVRA